MTAISSLPDDALLNILDMLDFMDINNIIQLDSLWELYKKKYHPHSLLKDKTEFKKNAVLDVYYFFRNTLVFDEDIEYFNRLNFVEETLLEKLDKKSNPATLQYYIKKRQSIINTQSSENKHLLTNFQTTINGIKFYTIKPPLDMRLYGYALSSTKGKKLIDKIVLNWEPLY